MEQIVADLLAQAKEGVGYLAVQAVPMLLEATIYQNEQIIELLTEIRDSQDRDFDRRRDIPDLPVETTEEAIERRRLPMEEPVGPTRCDYCTESVLKKDAVLAPSGFYVHDWCYDDYTADD